jgi:hypothetical protein
LKLATYAALTTLTHWIEPETAVLVGVDFIGARANLRTWWPSGFDPQAHGISIERAEAAYTSIQPGQATVVDQ